MFLQFPLQPSARSEFVIAQNAGKIAFLKLRMQPSTRMAQAGKNMNFSVDLYKMICIKFNKINIISTKMIKI